MGTIRMIKKIMLSAEEGLIAAARAQAQKDRTTLNNLFRQWLERYTSFANGSENYQQVMKGLRHVSSRGPFTRDQNNER
jgi:hypothetical protein